MPTRPPDRAIIQRPRWYPNVKDWETQDAFTRAFEHLYHLQDTMQKMDKMASARLTTIEISPNTQAIVREVQIGGRTPLNVTGLLGVLAQPQVGGAATGTATPAIADPLSQSGALFILTPSNTLYYFKATSDPGTWTAIAATGVIQFGARSAKPAAGNNGYTYFETDTGWYYYDNGTNYLYVDGINKGTDAARLALTIGANDNGAMFYTTDTNVLWRVAAGAWTQAFISLTAGITGILPYANGGTNASTAWTAGSVIFAGVSAFAQDNANLFWDNTNKRLGVGTAVPVVPFHLYAAGNSLSGTGFYVSWLAQNTPTNRGVVLGYDSSGQIGLIAPSGASGSLAFWTHNGTAWAERMRLDLTGSFGIGVTAFPAALSIVGSSTTRASVNIAAGTAPTTPNDGDHWYHSTQKANVLQQTGASLVVGGAVNVATTAVTVGANSTADQNLMSFSVPANSLNVIGKCLRLFGAGLYTTQLLQTPTLTFKIKLGALTLVTWTSGATIAAVTNNPWNFDFVLTDITTGATGTVEGHGNLKIDLGAAATVSLTAYADANTGASAAIDLTAAQTLQVTVAFSTQPAGAPFNACTQRPPMLSEVLN